MTISATKIEMLLGERGLTKRALAANCGISAQNISTIVKRGTCTPTSAAKLAQGLGVSVADIIAKEG